MQRACLASSGRRTLALCLQPAFTHHAAAIEYLAEILRPIQSARTAREQSQHVPVAPDACPIDRLIDRRTSRLYFPLDQYDFAAFNQPSS